jgi:hypothetical protein
MNREFTPYDRALKLKQLGFDEECFGVYNDDKTFHEIKSFYSINFSNNIEGSILAPLFSQAFRFFREKYDLHGAVRKRNGNGNIYFEQIFDEDVLQNGPFDTYKEAELACLDRLIEIVEGRES